MYQGPDLNELIAEAYAENKKIVVDKVEALTILKITFKTAYKKLLLIYSFLMRKRN